MSSTVRRSSRLAASTSLAATAVVEAARTSCVTVTAVAQSSSSRAGQTRGVQYQASVSEDDIADALAGGRQKKRARRASASSDLTSLEAESSKVAPAKKTKKPRKKADVVEFTPEDFPKRPDLPWKIGPHVSAAGGVQNAVLNAASLGATAFALFLKSQRKWDSAALTPESIDSFKKRLDEFGYDCRHVMPHGNYLINLGNPDDDKRAKSYSCFVDDLKRCEQLGLLLYNFHPGSSVGQGTMENSLALIAECINRAHKETDRVITVIETMVGAGSVVGSKFSEIGQIIAQVEDKSRVGVCIDTCHVFSAGYDIRTKEGWDATMAEFERDIGLNYLRGMHINDSKAPLASRKDRHENIGLGHLGLRAFAHIVNDARTRDIPLILETPAFAPAAGAQLRPGEGWDVWSTEVRVLQRLAGAYERADETVDLEAWTDEIRAAVKKASAKAADDAAAKKQRVKKRAKKAKGEDEDEAGDDSCEEL
ncbi:AP endonuclease [Phanerochaete sordida]|uniref:Apurinic-apyrimidinic endonuclease 1 n=1 Tax=Phanerochaete sordida TaxID=48140 RepID=A0A9P3GQK6_9APHY|nr:AP endonuclease [Phanerochaete sordida]